MSGLIFLMAFVCLTFFLIYLLLTIIWLVVYCISIQVIWIYLKYHQPNLLWFRGLRAIHLDFGSKYNVMFDQSVGQVSVLLAIFMFIIITLL